MANFYVDIAVIAGVSALCALLAPSDILGWNFSKMFDISLGAVIGTAALVIHALWESRRTRHSPSVVPEKAFVQRAFTPEELSWYDGVKNAAANVAKPGRVLTEHPLPEYDGLIFVGVKGIVYSVSSEWYGPESPYHAFAGRDSSRHLGKVVVGTEECNCDWTTLGRAHLKVLDEWEAKFQSKYPVVGTVRFGDDFKTKAQQFSP